MRLFTYSESISLCLIVIQLAMNSPSPVAIYIYSTVAIQSSFRIHEYRGWHGKVLLRFFKQWKTIREKHQNLGLSSGCVVPVLAISDVGDGKLRLEKNRNQEILKKVMVVVSLPLRPTSFSVTAWRTSLNRGLQMVTQFLKPLLGLVIPINKE